MRYYADHASEVVAFEFISELQQQIETAADPENWLQVLIETGKLVQGILDRKMEESGQDDWGQVQSACSLVMLQAAQAWHCGGSAISRTGLRSGLDFLLGVLGEDASRLPLRLVVPEGFAFYAVHPLQYYFAASLVRDPQVKVIGIRSIGTTLGAVVSLALQSRLAPVFLRPVGHPFDRKIQASHALKQELKYSDPKVRFAVVDEGPGLSGTSFGSVAGFLEELGLERTRIIFFPSHPGEPGKHASPELLQLWRQTPRFYVPLAPEWLGLPPQALDISGGQWRKLRQEPWLPSIPMTEKRKYLYRNQSGVPILAKFAGFGSEGIAKYVRAQASARSGMTPVPLKLQQGFVHETWIEDTRSVRLDQQDERRKLIEATVHLLAVNRSFAWSHPNRAKGATGDELLQMTIYNTSLALNEDSAERKLGHWRSRLEELTKLISPVPIDGKLHVWEWLVTSSSRLVKTDSWDHACSHDLIGWQDPAWDVAGATIEFELNPAELQTMLAQLAMRGIQIHRKLLDFYHDAYLAFQGGTFLLAAESNSEDSQRLRALGARYFERMRGDS